MKSKVVIVISCLIVSCLSSFANSNLESKVTRAVVNQGVTSSSKVQLLFSWEKKKTVYDYVHRNRRKNQNVVVSIEREDTRCQGTLLVGGAKIITLKDCMENGSFDLKTVRYTLSNGKSEIVSKDNIQEKGDFSYISINPATSKGLRGASLASVPSNKSLQEEFGERINLFGWLMNHNIFPGRARYLVGSGKKVSLQKGQAFFVGEKVVALVNSIPRISRMGSVSESFLTILRIANH